MVKASEKKKKGPAIFTEQEHLDQFNLQTHDLVRSSVGKVAAVIGVKYASANDAASRTGGILWVRYDTGLEAPMDWSPQMGCSKCSVAEHIRRDVSEHAASLAAMEEEHKKIEEDNRLRALGEDPGGGAGKKAAAAGKKKKKK